MTQGRSLSLGQRTAAAEDRYASYHPQSVAFVTFVRGEEAVNFNSAISSLTVFPA